MSLPRRPAVRAQLFRGHQIDERGTAHSVGIMDDVTNRALSVALAPDLGADAIATALAGPTSRHFDGDVGAIAELVMPQAAK